jgi:hypothetical protein
MSDIAGMASGPKKRKIPLALKIVGGIVIGIGVLLVVAFFILSSATKIKDVKFGDDVIPTLNGALGLEKKVESYSKSVGTGGSSSSFVYVDVSESIMTEYVEFLRKEGFVVTENKGDNTMQLGKHSRDSGKILGIDLKLSTSDKLTIEYKKAEGTLTIFESDPGKNTPVDMQTIGNSEYGYMDIPKTWKKSNDTGMLSYTDGSPNTFVHMNLLSGTAEELCEAILNEEIEEVGEAKTTVVRVSLAGIIAYEVTSFYPDNCVLIQWVFESEKTNLTHYLALEAPISEFRPYLPFIESYRFK